MADDDQISWRKEDGPLPEQKLLHAELLLTFVYLRDHQAKDQFVTLARQLLLKSIDWTSYRRHINRLGIRDLTGAIILALHEYQKQGGQCIIAIDDMTSLPPTSAQRLPLALATAMAGTFKGGSEAFCPASGHQGP